VAYMLVLRPVKKQAMLAFRQLPKNLLPAPGVAGEIESPGTAEPEIRRVAALRKQVLDKVNAEPADASRLVQSWLQGSES